MCLNLVYIIDTGLNLNLVYIIDTGGVKLLYKGVFANSVRAIGSALVLVIVSPPPLSYFVTSVMCLNLEVP
jgi:hypothetical protein